MANTIRVGDKIWRKSDVPIKHYGIYVGRFASYLHAVVHNSKDDLKVVVDEFEAFSKGRTVYIEQSAAPGYEQIVANRALSLLGRGYDLLHFNCEHFANLVQKGDRSSQQLQVAAVVGGAFVVVAGAIGIAAAIDGAKKPAYDEAAGRYRDENGRFTRG